MFLLVLTNVLVRRCLSPTEAGIKKQLTSNKSDLNEAFPERAEKLLKSPEGDVCAAIWALDLLQAPGRIQSAVTENFYISLTGLAIWVTLVRSQTHTLIPLAHIQVHAIKQIRCIMKHSSRCYFWASAKIQECFQNYVQAIGSGSWLPSELHDTQTCVSRNRCGGFVASWLVKQTSWNISCYWETHPKLGGAARRHVEWLEF